MHVPLLLIVAMVGRSSAGVEDLFFVLVLFS